MTNIIDTTNEINFLSTSCYKIQKSYLLLQSKKVETPCNSSFYQLSCSHIEKIQEEFYPKNLFLQILQLMKESEIIRKKNKFPSINFSTLFVNEYKFLLLLKINFEKKIDTFLLKVENDFNFSQHFDNFIFYFEFFVNQLGQIAENNYQIDNIIFMQFVNIFYFFEYFYI